MGYENNEVDIYNSILFGMFASGLFLGTPVFGVLSDRYQSRKTPMLIGLVALSVMTIVFALSKSLAALIFARILQGKHVRRHFLGVSAAASWVIGLALLADVIPKEKLGVAMGIVLSGHTLGYLLGPVVGGVMGQYISTASPFYVCAFLALLDFFGRLYIQPQVIQNYESSISQKSSIVRLISIPQIWIYGIAVLLGSCSFSAFEGIIAIYLKENFNLSEAETGYMFIAAIVPNIIVSTFVGHLSDKYDKYLIISIGMILHSLAAPLMMSCDSISTMIPAMSFFGASASVFNTPSMPEMAAIVHRYGFQASNAQVYAIYNMCYSLGMLLAPIIAAYIKISFGSFWSLTAFSIATMMYLPIFYLSNAKIMNLFQNS
ncbi:MFS general substrate transporter [Rozella allomycis CSF55]|uniref:MFS general substrate transporter n=1 Tax=Rozella allomycis (strain CSF55) TaxID=988480 RepID=A0A075ASR0_ROZAC|nr:Major facilitator superfamily domain-containing protein [Rozella allomycis CSF55]RKP20605.1 MFS general substrate transporter [Rozella allomycis CSF55]|eukprot:EPZ33298.1 Major facilitator superfamily domain-containing protein [Rozella allomycis CSF55]